MESNSFLSPNQHGFCKNSSYLTQLLDHVDPILKTLKNGEEVDVIHLDYAKVFDKVDHKILLTITRRYGISGRTLQWLAELLGSRLQTMVVEGTKSSFSLVLSGVSQGPNFLFIFYTDDQLDMSVTAIGKIFADDTRIVDLAVKSILQEDLFYVICWEVKNMQLNESKFEVPNYKLNHNRLLQEMVFSSQT